MTTLGDAPIQREFKEVMNMTARTLDKVFNGNKKGKDKKVGFVLLVFPFNDGSYTEHERCNFISNGADRKDVVTLMKEMIARFEGQPDVVGHG
jgi:hypothetical protein